MDIQNIIIPTVGTLAALASMTSFIPQAWNIIQTRDTSSISPGTYCLTVSAFTLWTLYGLLLQAWPLAASNAVCFILSGFILIMTLLPQDSKDAVAAAVTDATKGHDRRR